jgi:RNA polymerase sigma factor (sigma-70 family)
VKWKDGIMPTYAILDVRNSADISPGEDPQDLGRLLRRAGDQDGTAWNELVTRYGQLVMGAARSVGLQPSDAADAAQLTWLRLLEHVGEIREPEYLPGWLSVTARREAVRIALKSKRYRLSAEPDTGRAGEWNVAVTDSYPVEGHYSPLVAAALAQLPPRYEKLIRELMSDDCPQYTEVAQRMGIPVGSIGPMRMRALHMLRQILVAAFGPARMAEAV